MYVCICNAVTDRAIRAAAREGVSTFAELRAATGCGDCCGSCEDLARDILDAAVALHVDHSPLIAVAA